MRQNAATQMQPFLSITFAAALLGAAIAGCSAGAGGNPAPNQAVAETTVALKVEPRMLEAPVSEPEELPGIDTSGLNARERKAYWRWVSQLYAPCTEVAVSIATCVKEARSCASCVPSARFLAQRARLGSSQNEALGAFMVRFGPDVKKIDLADSPARGPASAPITIVVWSDYECPACGYAVPLLEEILEKHANEVRLVHKLFPLKAHPHSRQAARAALAAKQQGKYWEMEKLLFANQRKLEDADLEGYAQSLKLDVLRFRRDLADPKAEEVIERDGAEANKQGLSGTPFIVINGREFDLGFFKLDRDLETWIAAELEIVRSDAERHAIGAVGAALKGEGLGPVGPLSTGVPAATVPASATPAAPSSAPLLEPTATPSAVPASAPSAAPSSAPAGKSAAPAKPAAAPAAAKK
jgi:predicted DsbA family dithiol-disulfide isomerase